MIDFFVPGRPMPQKRPKVYRRGNFIQAVDPSKKDKLAWVKLAKTCAKLELLDGPLAVTLVFHMPIPKSLKRKIEPGMVHCKKPDIDNLIKFTLDALTGVLFFDDSHVAQITAKKTYSDNIGTRVNIQKVKKKAPP